MDEDFYTELLQNGRDYVQRAEAELRQAERRRRVYAAITVRAGLLTKTAIADQLNITRPTLDSWLQTVASTPGEAEQVDEHFAFIARRGL